MKNYSIQQLDYLRELLNLPIKDERYTSFIIKQNPWYFLLTWWKLNSEEKMNAYLNSDLWKDASWVLFSLDYLNDINRFLQIYKHLKDNNRISESQILKWLIKNTDFVVKLLSIIEESSLNVEENYVSTFINFKTLILKNKPYIENFFKDYMWQMVANNIQISSKMKNEKKTEEEIEQWKEKHLESIRNILKKRNITIDDEMEKKIQGLKTEKWINEFYAYLVYGNDNEEKSEKQKIEALEVFEEILEKQKAFLESLNKSLASKINISHIKNKTLIIKEKNEKWEEIERLNEIELKEQFRKFTEWKTEEEREKLQEQFIKDNFENLDPKEREVLIEILENIKLISHIDSIQASFPAYDDYIRNWWEWNFRDYLIEKWINPDETKEEKEEKEARIQAERAEQQKSELGKPFFDGQVLSLIVDEKIVDFELDEYEKKIVENDKSGKALENMKKFVEIIYDIWLENLLSRRKQIFQGISNIEWMELFRLEDDYLNEDEMKIFLNAILKSTWSEGIDKTIPINGFLEKFKTLNNQSATWKVERTNSIYWYSKIEQEFIWKFLEDNWEIKQTEFENSIR
jgi:hypothetical protein